jgi:hypothetical protein
MSSLVRKSGLFLAGALLAAAAPAREVKEVHKTLPLNRDGRVSIDTYKGSITVSTSDAAEVSIDARIEHDPDDADSWKKVQETEVRIRGGGSSVEIRSDYSRVHRRCFLGLFGNGTMPLVRYTIKMPATARLRIEDYKSEIRVADLRADLKLHTYKGNVEIAGQGGAIDLETYKGEVTVAFARFSSPARFETYKGSVTVRLPAETRFELDADMGRRGDFESDFDLPVRASRRGGSETIRGSVGGGGPKLSFHTYKGSLRLKRG